MTLRRVVRLGDTASGTCSAHTGGTRGWTGAFDTATGGFTIGGIQAVCVNDSGPTSCGHRFKFVVGDSILTGFGGTTIAREGDPVVVYAGGNGVGVITSGSNIVTSE